MNAPNAMPETPNNPDSSAGDKETTLRSTLAAFDARQQKIIGGLITVMLRHPERVREREWMAEQLTQVTLLAGGFGTDEDVAATVSDVGTFLTTHAAELMSACFQLFGLVGEEMAARDVAGFTYDDAVAAALGYLGTRR